MEISSQAPAMVANNARMVGDAVAITVLKKANELEGQSALALLQAAVQAAPRQPDPGASLGRLIDVHA